MPIIKSAKKELRKSKTRLLRNKKIKDNLDYLMKKGRQAMAGNKSEAKDLLAKTFKALDKAAQKGIIKKNTANRRKSRLNKQFNRSLKV